MPIASALVPQSVSRPRRLPRVILVGAAIGLVSCTLRHTPSAPSLAPAPPTPPEPTVLPVSVPAPPAPREATASSGDLEVAFAVPAWDAVLVRDRVVVIDPGFESLSGYDATNGARRWQLRLPHSPSGRHTLRTSGQAVFFWAGDRLHRVDGASGAEVSDEAVPHNGDCAFAEQPGACAFQCSCSFQLASCESGRRLGASFRKTYIEMFGADGEPPQTGCFGGSVGLIAAANGVAVAEVEDMRGKQLGRFSRERVAVGLDAATGRELWRSNTLAGASYGRSGALGDRGWIARSDGSLLVFDPHTGRVVWSRPNAGELGRVPRSLIQLDEPHGLLFRQLEGEAELVKLASGARVWRATVPAGAWALLEGAEIPLYEVTSRDEPLSVLVLAGSNGAVRGRVTLAPHATLHHDPGGGFYAAGEAIAAYDASGRERARIEHAEPRNLQAHGDFVALFDREQVVLLDRRDLHVVGALSGSFAVQPGGSLAAGVLLYRYVDGGKLPGEALLVRVKRRP